MDKKTLLNYRAMELELEQLSELIERVDARITEAKIPKLSLQPKGQGMAHDVIGANLAHLEALKEMYERRCNTISSTLMEIEEAIDGLESSERILMRYRYIEGMKWNDIAEKMKCSERDAKREHGRILQKLKMS